MKYKSLFSIMLSCSLFLTAGTIDFASYQTLPAGESLIGTDVGSDLS